MKKTVLKILCIFLIISTIYGCNKTNTNIADTVIYGNITTMDDKNPTAEAVAIKDGIISFVGNRDDVKQYIDDNTNVLDYGDNYIYPGFLESHAHAFMTGYRAIGQADLSMIFPTDFDAYREIIKKYIEDNPNKDIYLAAGWEENNDYVNKEYLDEICSDKPLIMNTASGHSILLNTKALEWAGIDSEFAKKMGYDIVHVDENGEPDGYVCETVAIDIVNSIPVTHEEAKEYILACQDIMFENGYTAIGDAGSELFYNEDIYDVYKELEEEGKLKLRVYSYLLVDDNVEDPEAAVSNAAKVRDKYSKEYYQIIGLKVFTDGVSEAGTSWLIEDSFGIPGYHGVERFNNHDKMVELITEADKQKFSVHAHCVGDGATRFMLNCIEDAEKITGDLDQRNIIAHLEFVTDEDIQRMADTKTIPAVAPLWCPKFPGEYEHISAYVGNEKNDTAYPIKSFYNAGANVVFHTDYPISPEMNVPKAIYMAETRKDPISEKDGYDSERGINESITRKQSLDALTKNVAYAWRQEDKLGTIEVGKIANMTVSSCDYINDDLDKMLNSYIVSTIVDGVEAYRNLGE